MILRKIFSYILLFFILLLFKNFSKENEESSLKESSESKKTFFSNFNNNNNKIINNYSGKESFIHYGLLLGPFLYKYWISKSPKRPGAEIRNYNYRYGGKKTWEKIVQEFNFFTIWNKDKKNIFWRLMNNTLFRGALIYFVLPRIFFSSEIITKRIQDWNNKTDAKRLFEAKKNYFNDISNDNITIYNKKIKDILIELKTNLEYEIFLNYSHANISDQQKQNKYAEIKNNIIKAINNIPPVNMEYNYNSLVTLRKEIEKQKLDYFIKNQPNSSQTRSELKKILNENKNSNVLLDWVIKNYPTIEKIGPQKFDNNFPGPFNSTFNDLDYIQSNKSWDDFKENNLHDKHYPNSAYLYNNNQSTIGNWNLIKPLDLIHAGVNFHENRLILD